MLSKIKNSFIGINYKLFFSFCFMGFCPAIYLTVRTYFLGNMPDDYAFSIAGQLNWLNLIYEVLRESLILPLFFFLSKYTGDKKEFTNKLKTGLIITFILYAIISSIILIFAELLLELMATSQEIIEDSAIYVRLEAISNTFGIMANFAFVALVSLGKEKYVYFLTVLKLLLLVLFDTFLISSLPFSAKMDVHGIGISDIVVSILMLIIVLAILCKEGFNIFTKDKMSFVWCRDFFKVGGLSGLESLVRNLFYMLMIVRMVNVVGEQGTYWVANNFIWGWLLLPIIALAELINHEVATNKEHIKQNGLGYIGITIIIVLIWLILIPSYKPFFQYVLNFPDVDKLYELVMILLGFYVLYALQNIWDSFFYGLGKTQYMLAESICTNTIYYTIFFILYLTGVYLPTLNSIALMFGGGVAFDAFVSFAAFVFMVKREKKKKLAQSSLLE